VKTLRYLTRFPSYFNFVSLTASKVTISEDIITEAERLWAPPDHEVFRLVPELFHFHASHEWQKLGSPKLTFSNVWQIFIDMLQAFHAFAPDPMQDIQLAFTETRLPGWGGGKADEIPLPPNEAPANLRAGLVRELHSITVIVTNQENEGDVVEEWADEEDRVFASFTDEENEAVEINDDQ